MTSRKIRARGEGVFMRRALMLAAKARGNTSPNPMVGAVFVKNGKILAEGFHARAGEAHAEVKALKKLSKRQIRGGVLYVTLEPCDHSGKTPPCTDFLIGKGLEKIVVAMRDPNLLVNGKGLRKLRRTGMEVRLGLLQDEAKKLNEAYVYSIVNKMPFMILKAALSLDGMIAMKWITNELSRKKVHELRSEVDAIITSSNTVLADDAHLGVRMVKGRDPKRVILDSKLLTPLTAKVYRDKNVVVAATSDVLPARIAAFKKAKIPVLLYRGTKIPLRKMLKDLYAQGISSVMLEAGSKLMTAFLREKLVQKIYFFIAPKILGNGLPIGRSSYDRKKMVDALQFQKIEMLRFGNDILLIGSIKTLK